MGKRLKYGNKKVIVDGIKFDSILEKDAYYLMKKLGVPFEFQVWHTLIPSFKYNGETIRSTNMRPDFVVKTPRGKVIMDTKGYASDTASLKYKMLKYQQSQLPFPEFVDIVWCKNKKEVNKFVIEIYDEIKNNS